MTSLIFYEKKKKKITESILHSRLLQISLEF